MPNLDRVYVDTCAWLALINREASRHGDLVTIYTMGKKAQIELWTSTITVVEAVRIHSEIHQNKPLPETTLADIDDVLMQEFIKLVPMDIEIARKSRQFRRELSNFSTVGDSIHLAAAYIWNADYIVTYDSSDLVGLDEKIERKDGRKLRILLPGDYITHSTFGHPGQ